MAQRGEAIWGHRRTATDNLKGSTRYEVLKRAEDDTDFRGILDTYNKRVEGCIFCSNISERILAENELCFAIRDGYPATEFHSLFI